MNLPESKHGPRNAASRSIEYAKNKLEETIKRGYGSSLYRDRWKTSGFVPDMFHSPDDLHLIPFITRKELFEATRNRRRTICLAEISHWFAGYDQADTYEWFPYSAGDFLKIAPMLARMSEAVGLRCGDTVLAIVDVPPRISSSIPYLWSQSDSSNTHRLEFIIGAMDWYDTLGMTWMKFMQRRRPTVVFASTRNAQALAEKIQATMKTEASNVLPETRIGIFYGKHLKTDITKLLESYSLEPFEVYSPTEHMSFCTECGNHRGIHLWTDTCVPEIIVDGNDEAKPISEAAPGTEGQLVITNFAECLPLVRYKTGKSIRVEGADQCACGHSDPRVTFLG